MECEALYLTEAVDEYTMFALTDFERKKFQNVANMGISAFDLVRATSFFLRMVGRGTLCLKNSEIGGSESQIKISGRMTAAEKAAVKSHMTAHKTQAAEAIIISPQVLPSLAVRLWTVEKSTWGS